MSLKAAYSVAYEYQSGPDLAIMQSTAITQIAPGLACLDSQFKVWACTGSVRMSVIGSGDDLAVYSPVALDAAHIAHIAALGRVCAIIAPNLYHHMFLRDAAMAFPNARVLVPLGLEAKIGPIPSAVTMTANAAQGLPADLNHHVFAGHAIRETRLFHRPSGTLVTADLLYNYHAEQLPAERAFFSLIGIYGRPAVPFYHRFAIQDKSRVRQLLDKVRSWPIHRIVPCHGRIVESHDAGAVFAAAWERFA